MSFASPSVRRPRIALPAGVAAMIAILAVGLLGVIPAAAAPAVPGPGYQDFQYNTGPDFSTGGDAVTGSRNQSKLWFNDGKWWAVMFDKTNAANPSYRIQSLNMATQTWTTGATATQADKRNKSHADVLSDGNTLWMASSHKSGTNIAPNGDLQVFKFTYNAATKKYTIVAGFPKVVAQGGNGCGHDRQGALTGACGSPTPRTIRRRLRPPRSRSSIRRPRPAPSGRPRSRSPVGPARSPTTTSPRSPT